MLYTYKHVLSFTHIRFRQHQNFLITSQKNFARTDWIQGLGREKTTTNPHIVKKRSLIRRCQGNEN